MQHAPAVKRSPFLDAIPQKYAVGMDKETLPKADYQFVMGELAR